MIYEARLDDPAREASRPLKDGMIHDSVDLGNRRSPLKRMWRGRPLHPLQEIELFLQNEGPVPETFRRLRASLERAGIAHIFVGATALGAHGFIRATEDVDVCLRPEDLVRFREMYVGSEYQTVPHRSRRFLDSTTGRSLDILVAGEIAGNSRKQQSVHFPDPSEAELHSDTRVPSLARLIELKLVTWRYKDWGDVVELIRLKDLTESFAEKLNPVARSAYLQCYDQKVEEDRYSPEIHDPPKPE